MESICAISTLGTLLSSLRDRVFKLLPMKEDYIAGKDNHLSDYLANLKVSIDGSFISYPRLQLESMMVEVQNNIAFLTQHNDLVFRRWRTIILRSTRLLNTLFEKYNERGD